MALNWYLAHVESSEHALGRYRTLASPGGSRRLAEWSNLDCRRQDRIDISTAVVSRRQALFRVGPQRLVEPLPRLRRTSRSGYGSHRGNGGATVGLWFIKLWVRIAAANRLHLFRAGMARLAIVDTETLKLESIDVTYTDLGFVRAAGGQAVFRAARQPRLLRS